MAADATLVNAAFREGTTGAMADVPDMKPWHESQKKVWKTYTGIVTNVMGILQKKEDQIELVKTGRLKPVKETIQKAYNALEQGEPLPQFVVNDFTKQIEDLQDQFEKVNTEGKGDTRANEQERRRITARLARLKNQAIDLRSKYMIAFQDPSSYNDPNIKDGDIDAINSIATAFSDPDAAAEMFKNGDMRGEFVNGEYTIHTKNYSTGTRKVRLKDPEETFLTDDDLLDEEEYKFGDEISYTAGDVTKALPYKNLNNDKNVNDFLAKEGNLGKVNAKNGDPNKYDDDYAVQAEVDEFYNNIIPTDEDYYDIASRRFLGVTSFKQALGGMIDIPIDILNNMFLDAKGKPVDDWIKQLEELDKDGDGDIDSSEYPKDKTALKKFMINIEKAKEEILKSRELGGPMIAKYFTDIKTERYNNLFNANIKEDGSEVTSTYDNINGE